MVPTNTPQRGYIVLEKYLNGEDEQTRMCARLRLGLSLGFKVSNSLLSCQRVCNLC